MSKIRNCQPEADQPLAEILDIGNSRQRRAGFTLVELIVTIALMGIFATGVFVVLNPVEQIRKANDAKRKLSLTQLQKALELYYQDTGGYPLSSPDYKISVNARTLAWGSAWQPYINTLPSDPLPSNSYTYYSPASSNGQTYYLYANLERGSKDEQACNKGNACVSLNQGGFPGANACGKLCNFGVSSANVSP